MAFADLISDIPPHACETASGRYVDVVTPDPTTIFIDDIAWALSRQARFAGHTLSPIVWSVGQHSLFVEYLMVLVMDPNGIQLHLSLTEWLARRGMVKDYEEGNFNKIRALVGGLIHDSTEAYLIDLPSPVKRHPALRAPYKELEERMHFAIEAALGLDPLTPLEHELHVWADMMALQIEAANLMTSRGRGWSGDYPRMNLLDIDLMPNVLHWQEVYEAFITRYDELTGNTNG